LRLVSPIDGQDFIWLAEYVDGTCLTEFDLQDYHENSFYRIEREKMLRFGLIGHDIKLFYEVFGGYFNLAGTFIELELVDECGEIYPITGKNEFYRDIITYKDAETSMDIGSGMLSKPLITKYNFGFKHCLECKGFHINSRVIFTIPFRDLSYFNFRLVSSKNFKGNFIIKYNGQIKESIPFEFTKNVGQEFNWIMK